MTKILDQIGIVWKEGSGNNCLIYKRNLHFTLYRIEYYNNIINIINIISGNIAMQP